jgi:hypothetical protein
MRRSLLILTLVVLAGCAEAVQGPRVVPYSETRFYVRHAPLVDSRSSVDELAASICARTGGTAALQSADQFVPLDIRYATYRCLPPAPSEADEQPT